MSQDQKTYRYAVMASVAGFIVQLALSLAMLVTAVWANSPALTATTWYFFAGLPVWTILILINNQHRLERAELLETEVLVRTDAQAAAIFDEHGIDLQVARRRLDRLYKWGLNTVSLLLAVYLLAVGIWLLVRYYNGLYGAEPLMAPVGERARGGVLVTIAVVLAFFAFLVARYVAGMTRVKEWQLLRGGAAYLMANAVVVVLIGIASLVMTWNVDDRTGVLFKPLAVMVPAIMVLVGFEICIMFLLGAYRPRRPGERSRPAFDSRVLGIFTSPESIGRIITETINYQFGLEVSRSWFYRLLARAITPLIIVGLVVLLLLNMFVIVGPHEEAVITRFGQIVGDPVSSGLHLKMPWPISRTKKYAVGRIHQVSVGSVATKLKKDVAILWTNPHSEGQEQYLVTAPPPWELGHADGSDDASVDGPSATGMSLVAADVIIQFRIADLKKYVRSSVKPQAMLTALSERRVSTYFVTHDIDTLLSRGRLEAGRILKSQIQDDTESAGLGIEIVFVGLTGIHPPQAQQVAASFHEQIGALQEKDTVIEQARQIAIETLAKVAGSRNEALAISNAIHELAELQGKRDRRKGEQTHADQVSDQLTQQINEKSAEVERLLMEARGEAATKIYEARAYRWQFAITERAKAERFKSELKAYDQAPQYYRARQYLDTLAQGLKDARKIIMTTEAEGPAVIRLDLKDVSSDFEGLLSGP